MKAKERSLSHRTMIGGLWLIGSGLATKSIDFVTLLVLAHILTPADFGLVAIAMSLIFVVEAVFELPLGQALLRLPDMTREHLNTVFTLSVIRGLVMASILLAAAWPFAKFYGDPRVTPLVCALGVAPIARGLTSPRLAEFARKIDFPKIFLVDLSGKVAAVVAAISLAVATHSYWSIAAGTILSPVAMVTASYVLAPFFPRLSLREWRPLAGFVGWSSASQLVAALNWQCDRLILARFTSARELGAFTMANDLATLPERTLIKALERPVMAAFSLIKDDPVRLRDAYTKTTTGVMAVGFPVMLGLGLLAAPAVRCALGGRWLAAVPLLQWLAFSSIPPLLTAGLAPLAMTLNQTRIFFTRSLLELCMKIPLVLVGAIMFGIHGVIAARLLSDTVLAIISMSLARSLIGISIARQLWSCWRVISAGAVMVGFLLLMRPILDAPSGFDLVLGLLGVATSAVVVYGLTISILWFAAGRPGGFENAIAERIDAVVGSIVRRTARAR